jgi:argininosuccinate lyase
MSSRKLWGGRFESGLDQTSTLISESISFDHELYSVDIEASIAHSKMLKTQKIITQEEFAKIQNALMEIKVLFEEDKIEFDYSLEDIHTHVESELIKKIGDIGKKLHTGRSRNDQVAVDTHLFLKKNILKQINLLTQLLQTINETAEKNMDLIWAGFTHTQIAQPVSLAHYILSYFEKFHRDLTLLHFVLAETDVSPLGSAAMAGANYPLDPSITQKELGFADVFNNSMDAISNRDYQLAYHFFASRLFIHISRFCEDCILYNTAEFGYVSFTDQVTTGSSIMPQKKNPDIAELLRGKSGRVIGNFQSLITTLKALPLTYNRDLQEDKVFLFDTIKQVNLGIKGMISLFNNITFHSEKVELNLKKGFALATDFADYLVSELNIPFRDSHDITGRVVAYCEKNKKFLEDLSESELYEIVNMKNFHLPSDFFDFKRSINRKNYNGATAFEQVKKQIKLNKKKI